MNSVRGSRADVLAQEEVDALIAMMKRFAESRPISLPPGIDDTRELIGADPKERFLLDIWRGTIRLSKYRYQTRARQIIVLVRLCIDGAPHTNPDGARLEGSHLHLYREGYDDKWAQPLDASMFPNPIDIWRTFEDFCNYCNIRRATILSGWVCMIKEECRQLVDAYVEWLRRGISAESVGEACELTDPLPGSAQ